MFEDEKIDEPTYSVVFDNGFDHKFGPFRSLYTAVTFALAECTDEHRATVVAS